MGIASLSIVMSEDNKIRYYIQKQDVRRLQNIRKLITNLQKNVIGKYKNSDIATGILESNMIYRNKIISDIYSKYGLPASGVYEIEPNTGEVKEL